MARPNLTTLDDRVSKLEIDFKSHCEDTKLFQEGISVQLGEIEKFVGGYNTILGLAKKHWKTTIVFGAGVMSAAGFGNPELWKFIGHFFGS